MKIQERFFKILSIIILALLVLAGCARSPERLLLSDEQRRLNLASFDYVWETIKERHWDKDLGGVDWSAVRDSLRPRMEGAKTRRESRTVLGRLISILGQSHFNIIPSNVYDNMERPKDEQSFAGTAGFDVRVIGGHAFVTSVREGTPAYESGIQKGWEVEKISDIEDMPGRLEPLITEFEGKSWKDHVITSVVTSRLSGIIGDSVSVRFIDAENNRVEKTIVLVEKKGRPFTFGHFPTFYTSIEVDTLPGGIGYISFNAFMDPVHVMPVFNEAMASFMDSDGVIIDVRGNPGGIIGIAMGMTGWLVEEKNRYLGTMFTRNTEFKCIIFPRVRVYKGPVAVLIDGSSGSCSEIFAGGLKDLGRARLFGSRTAGAVLPSVFERLPNGDGFQYAFADYFSAGGERLEGIGVTPDIEIFHTHDSLLQGKDIVLEEAVEWIREKE